MAKETTKGEELSALGKQTMAHAYSAMDYYFDHLKKTIASVEKCGQLVRIHTRNAGRSIVSPRRLGEAGVLRAE